jgi:NACHT domain
MSGKTHFLTSSAIIEDLGTVSGDGGSYLGYFFFDFKDIAKQDNRALLSSLLIQLSTQSDPCFKILFDIYSKHKDGSQQPNEGTLLQCLKDMLKVLGQAPIYIIIDAVDECPNAPKEPGSPLSRQEVLDVVKELVNLRLPNLHVCITSRPEVDIRNAIEKLARLRVSLHDQDGQKEDITTYVRSVVYSDKYLAMKKWGKEVKERVIEDLSSKAGGMYVYSFKCMMDADVVTQVSLGCVPAGCAAGMSRAQCPTSPHRIARHSRRNLRTCFAGDKQVKPKGSLSPVAMPRGLCAATSSPGACRSPCA